MEQQIYDIAIVGGGPAGLTAAIYGLRAGLKVCLVERLVAGGQVSLTDTIENYPGFKSITGAELGNLMQEHAEKFGLEIIYDEVQKFNFDDEVKTLFVSNGTILAYSIILSMGASARKLNLLNEESLQGRGVSYCATCDGAFYKNKNVVVVGGGNTAVEDALYLSKFAKNVYLVHRRDEFKADKVLSDEIDAESENGKIHLIYNSIVTELIAKEKLQAVKIKNMLTQNEDLIDAEGLFIAIGRQPDTEYISHQIDIDENGYIKVNENSETNIHGVYAAGDVANKKLKQIATAVGEGAIAANNARIYLANLKAKKRAK